MDVWIYEQGHGYQFVSKKWTGADALSAGLVEDHKACFPGNTVLRKRLDDWTTELNAWEQTTVSADFPAEEPDGGAARYADVAAAAK